MRRLSATVVLALTAWLWLAAGQEGAAQPIGPVQSPILTVDSDRLFSDSEFGKQTVVEFETRGAELSSENRQIEEALEAEEQALTDQRATMDPAEFRALADAFDEKVQATRRTQDAKTRRLSQDFEQRRNVFLQAAAPVLEGLMREAGAAVILDRRSLFLSSNAIDITNIAIQRLNAVLGDGAEPIE